MMIDDAPIQYWSSETERNAYNAAFYELGLRWHWDRETYCQLLRQSQDGPERVCHYLSTHQPHLAARLRRQIAGRGDRAEEGSAPAARIEPGPRKPALFQLGRKPRRRIGRVKKLP
jgi:hypothetical protein